MNNSRKEHIALKSGYCRLLLEACKRRTQKSKSKKQNIKKIQEAYFPTSVANIVAKKTNIKKVQTTPTHNPSKLDRSLIDKTDDLPRRLVDWENDSKAKA